MATPRFLPLNPQASTGSSGGGDLGSLLGRLGTLGSTGAKALGKLSDTPALGNVGTGLSGLVGLTRGIGAGDPGQAIGGAANLGSGIAGLANMPGVSSALGAVGGPLSFATGLASGDPVSSTLGGLQTASLASGALGGQTISSLASSLGTEVSPYLASLLSTIAPDLAASLGIGAGAAGAGAGAGATAAAASTAPLGAMAAAAAPFALMALGGLNAAITGGGDLFDTMFGTGKTQTQLEYEKYKKAAAEFPDLAKRRIAGAGLFDHLGDYDTPDEVRSGLEIASSGRSADPDTAAYNISHPSKLLKIKNPTNLDAWERASPLLAGHNWGSFLNLMDQGEGMGLDPGGLTGDWATDVVNEGGYFKPGENLTGEDYRNRPSMTMDQVQAIARGDDTHRDPMGPTQEIEDLGNAIGGMGQHLGIDFNRIDPANPNAGYADWQNFDPDQLKDYGFTAGNYGPASLNYLRSFDPSVTERPEWGSYAQALDPGNALADLDPLTLRPRKKPTVDLSYMTPELNLGGG